jgi:hypothetical protein
MGMNNIPLFPILIVDQCNPGIPVGVVLDRYDFGWDIVLIAAEVNDTIQTLVSTTTTPTSNDTAIVATFGAMLGMS